METYLSFFLLIVNVKTSVFGLTLPQYSFMENCGNTIGFSDTAGEITFKSSNVFYTSYRHRQCDVRVSPKSLRNRSNKVMFYFTEFDLGASCQYNYNNLTVYDGRYSLKIKGLPDVLCGHNTSLEESKPVFKSEKNEIRLLFRWNEYGERFPGSFKLTFITYYKGPCSEEDNTFACSNDRCISSHISCNGDINYCGNGDDVNCDKFKPAEQIDKFKPAEIKPSENIDEFKPAENIDELKKAGNTLVDWITWIVVICVIAVVIGGVIKYQKRHHCISMESIIRSLHEENGTRSPNTSAGFMNYNRNARRSPIIRSGNNIVSDTRSTNIYAGSMNYNANVGHSPIIVSGNRIVSDGAHGALRAQNPVPSAGSMNYNANSTRTSIILSENNHVEQQESFAPPLSEMTFSTQTSVV